jgi:hypothetical protein
MPKQSTIAVVLLAGDCETIDQIDRLLIEIQKGMKQPSANSPSVYCLYHRYSSNSGATETHQFLLTCQQEFAISGQCGLTNFPPQNATVVTGDLSDQLTAFLEFVDGNLPTDGPVHVIIGAHGVPANGFNPVKLIQLFLLTIASYFNVLFRGLSLRSRFLQLRDRLFRNGHPLGALASGSTLPALTLDAVALSLKKLRRTPQSILIHTCNLSSVETMCALNAADFHIACESLLSSTMKVSEWFSTLANPSATSKQIADACFDHMLPTGSGNAEGCFSAHKTADSNLLAKLDDLGAALKTAVTSNDTATIAAIVSAQTASKFNRTIDLVKFCSSLKFHTAVSQSNKSLACAVIDAIVSLRLRLYDTDPYPNNYGGICIYLPERYKQYYSPDHLPEAFRTGSPEWFEFVKLWGGTA